MINNIHVFLGYLMVYTVPGTQYLQRNPHEDQVNSFHEITGVQYDNDERQNTSLLKCPGLVDLGTADTAGMSGFFQLCQDRFSRVPRLRSPSVARQTLRCELELVWWFLDGSRRTKVVDQGLIQLHCQCGAKVVPFPNRIIRQASTVHQ